jgi:hypothetical protein
MGSLLEVARYGLEGIEVLFAFAVTGLLGIGLIHARQAEAAQRHPLDAETRPER